jgi:hypothetical protein
LEEGGVSCPVKMGAGEDEVMGQRGEKLKNRLDIFIFHHSYEKNEVTILELFFQGLP